LCIEASDDLGLVRGWCAAAIQFGANAGEMGPGDMMSGRGGPTWKVANNWEDCDVDTNGSGGRRGWCGEVEADIEGAFGRVVG
jgi:hypothetical protein